MENINLFWPTMNLLFPAWNRDKLTTFVLRFASKVITILSQAGLFVNVAGCARERGV
jgi:hypothetical protein